MYNRIIEFSEFKRLKDEVNHLHTWENEYRSHTKEMLLNQLLEEQEDDYPNMRKCPKENKKFHALINVLDEKSSTPWLKQVLQTLRENVQEAYRKLADKVN